MSIKSSKKNNNNNTRQPTIAPALHGALASRMVWTLVSQMSSPTYACSSARPSPRVDAPRLGIHCHCSSKSRSQATLSPGNTSLVHQGEDLSQAQREKKAEGKKKKKGRTLSSPLYLSCILIAFFRALYLEK